jgi:pyruvate formate lyase activating enzyme
VSAVKCTLCPHECVLRPGERGGCRARINYQGKLVTLVYGKAISANPYDPVEKKPLFHFLPGARCFSIATAGCNLHCKFCQNYSISQLNPEDADPRDVYDLPPDQVAALAARNGCRAVAYTYSEPIIYFEYTRDCQRAARALGIKNILVTAGYINEKPLRELCRETDAINLDIKSFDDDFYRNVCGGSLEPVLKGLRTMQEEGVWLELTNLVVPTLNDNLETIKRMCGWIVKNAGPEAPLHFSRFHPMYQLTQLPPTPAEILIQARETALAEGIRYVYVGNVEVAGGGDTVCPGCRRTLIRRQGYTILELNLKGGKCAFCGREIPGRWS